ncbi:Protein kinase domain [Macleaya cordata]|uniref:Protein kinase domain n=1 Tax=Macleaya cordata TaxID=56857 RepID=A0A200QNG8_MACCD|nr:Protein kinase domain [Macleaya cordata]
MIRSRKKIKLLHLLISSIAVLFIVSDVGALEDDIRCLKGVKSSLKDPQGRLETWVFENSSVGFICKFPGVSCWNERENRLITLQLNSMELAGQIPDSIQYCPSLQTLDLSGNKISGTIPSKICDWLPYLVTLDLSRNDLTGPIPSELVNCKFLNSLVLSDNRLTGPIPYQLSRLERLKKLSVSNNDLSGEIPQFLSSFNPADFDGNQLCGRPLGSKCGGKKNKNLIIIIAAGVSSAVVSLLIGFAIWWWFFVRYNRRRRAGAGKFDDSKWGMKLRPHKLVQVSLFKKPLVKVKLADLMAATNNFNQENIIISTRTGTSYKAVLPDGSALAIKRLHACNLSEKQFRSEMIRLGQLRHPNLVPLLGFCVVEDEKLLVYKYMPGGTLYSLLHREGELNSGNGSLDWSTRLRIAVGIARGLAWLHHGCQPPFLHQNVSSNSILLDDDLEPRITDFGLGKLINSDVTHDSTFISGALGEFGYVAPEYSSTMVASLKGDVYGFGVVLMELVTGQKPLDVTNGEEEFKGNLVEWVNQLSGLGRIRDTIDKSLCGKGYDDEILQVLRVASACVVSRPKDRGSMYQAHQSLKTIGAGHGFSEQFDEFPLIFGKQDPDHP